MARLRAQARRTVENIAAREDAGDRARAATEAIDVLGQAVAELTSIRDAAARELSPGRSHSELAKVLGVHRSRVGQILKRAGNGAS